MKIDSLSQVGYKIIQDETQFCFGIDAVLLADFASKKIRKNSKVIDLCTGNGIIPLLVHGTAKPAEIAAVEIQKNAALLAQQSVELNSLETKIKITNDDIKNVSALFEKYSFDFVICNPPYAKAMHGKESPTSAKAIARHEILCTLQDVIKSAEYLLKPNGHFFMIHRPERLTEIIVCLNKFKMEASAMRFVQSTPESAPSMVLIEARKNIKPNLKVEPSSVIYKEQGIYTDEVQAIYSGNHSFNA